MPKSISDFGATFDRQFYLTMIVVGSAFVAVQILLSVLVWGSAKEKSLNDSLRVEIVWTLFSAIVFIALAFLGQRVWAELISKPDTSEVFKVEVTAQQFQWNFHYAGKDNLFGARKTELINDAETNFIGLDRNEEKAKDDIVSSVLVVPANRVVELTLKSRDVTHNFWVAPLRFKQDVVPGLTVKISFKPTRTGKYEIACAELCGAQHYKMKSYLLVVSEDEAKDLMLLSQDEFQTRVGKLLLGTPSS